MTRLPTLEAATRDLAEAERPSPERVAGALALAAETAERRRGAVDRALARLLCAATSAVRRMEAPRC